MSSTPADKATPSDHVAWLCYINHGQDDDGADILTIEVCDSDAKGAFKVYTRAQSAAVEGLVEKVELAVRDLEEMQRYDFQPLAKRYVGEIEKYLRPALAAVAELQKEQAS